jgi:hypothetical protein
MHNDSAASALPHASGRRLIWGAAFVLIIAIAGLFYIKWSPYYAKTFVAAAHHSIGSSIVSGKVATPPPATWSSALSYAKAYYLAIWQALLLGLILGAAVQVFFPRRWIYGLLGGIGLRSTVLGGIFSLAGMM